MKGNMVDFTALTISTSMNCLMESIISKAFVLLMLFLENKDNTNFKANFF